MTNVIFWGATGQALVLRELLEGTEYRLIALFDNRPISSPFSDVPLFVGQSGFESWLPMTDNKDDIRSCVAIGGNRGRERLEIQEWLAARGVHPITLIHRTAFVASNAAIGEGTQILAQAAVCANVRLGRAVILNTAASVDHGGVIGDGVHVGPGVTLAGEVIVEPHVFIGAGATVLPHVRIGRDTIIGAGAVVTKDVAPSDTVVGNPARSIKQH